ncbi:RNA polymerase sigma factor [Mucilaginibacter sp. AW1-3]
MPLPAYLKGLIMHTLTLDLVENQTEHSYIRMKEVRMPALRSLSDEELLPLFKAGDPAAFDEIYLRFHGPLRYFASEILDDEFAEDIVQDALIKTWQRHQQFDKFYSLRSFLYTTVKRACFDQLDKRKVRERHQLYVANNPDFEQTALQGLIRSETVRLLYSAVDTLPEQCKKIILLTYEQGLKPIEIAELLNVSVSTVGVQKMRGLKLLRDRLSGDDLGAAVLLIGLIEILH